MLQISKENTNILSNKWNNNIVKGMEKYLHPTDTVGCNYFSLPLIPASGTQVIIYKYIGQIEHHWFMLKLPPMKQQYI